MTKESKYNLLFLLIGVLFLIGLALSPIQWGSNGSLVSYGAGMLLFTLLLYRLALNTTQPARGLFLLLPGLLGIRLLTLSTWLDKLWESHAFFAPLFTAPFTSSLWDLIWNATLVFFTAVYFHKRIQLHGNGQWSTGIRMALSVGVYLSMGAGLVGVGLLFQALALHTDLPFNFEVIVLTGWPAFIAILCGLIVLLSVFLFTQRMMQVLAQIENRQFQRMGALAVAIGIITILNTTLIPSTLPLAIQMVLILLYLLVSDLYVDYDRKSHAVTWGIAWVGFLSLFAAAHLMGGSLEKEHRHRLAVAQALVSPQDSIAENALEELTRSPQTIDTAIRKYPYLFQNYDYKQDDSIPFTAKAIKQNLWHEHTTEYFSYFIKMPESEGYWHFQPALESSYPILQAGRGPLSFKGIDGIEKLKVAVMRSDTIVAKNFNPKDLASNNIPIDKWTSVRKSKFAILIYQGRHQLQAHVITDAEVYIQLISLFSFLFVILMAFVLLWSIEVRWGGWLSGALLPFGNWQSLQNRIQIAFLGLFVLSFLVIGAVTVSFSRQSEIDQYVSQVGQKSGRVQRNLQSRLSENDPLDDQLAKKISTTQELDILLYDTDGQLVGSSPVMHFFKNALPKQIPVQALTELNNGNKAALIQDTLGPSVLQYTYASLKNEEQLKGYFALPHLTLETVATNSYAFVSMLMNIYVVLLLVTAAIAIVIARYITQPITQLGIRLRNFDLDKNEPLPWKRSTKDEIGEMISSYNQMVNQLDERTRQLKQKEREGAWREMAKQVAHEIKNPLTPMKLCIQHLKRAFQAQPENIEPLLQRVSATLIEQIDGLARIASDFSNFAKMPKTQNSTFVLNDIVSSVSELFKTTSDLQLDVELPDHPISVFADKEHLVRVLNNLIKNAIQSIPDDRKGHIRVQLRQEKDQAILSVQDNGSGIPEELQEKVFYPNFTTKSSGSGLGLAIAKNSIEAANGRMWLETEEGKGTTFFVELLIDANEY